MYAIIDDGSRQVKVEKGATIRFDRRPKAKPGEKVEFDRVLVYHDGKSTQLGAPVVPGVKVVGEIVKEARAEKLRVYKYRRREGWQNTTGHRQKYTLVKITDIVSK
jgi:large subunit ribosomal protein L21